MQNGSARSVDYDVVIVGAGLSGINFAYRLQERNPDLTYCIVEGRHEVGGTWSLFKYPGIRSDSDLYTFSFPWRPWKEKESIARGDAILNYLKESIEEQGIDKHIKYNHIVNGIDWSTDAHTWTFDITANGDTPVKLRSRFVFGATGYYNYNEPLKAEIPGLKNFNGTVIHPQFWPEDLDYTDKNIVIVGSGATAITLLPSVSDKASHVTMLQRSPSYIVSVPGEGLFETITKAILPTFLAYRIIRFKWTVAAFMLVTFCRWFPRIARRAILRRTKAELPKGTSLDPDFTPRYNPWDQRMCLCPDADFYAALKSGKGSLKTGEIENVTAKSIKLKSGDELHPDIIVTATGLKLCVFGSASVSVDGKKVNVPDHYVWKGCMLSDVPNMAFAFGYVDASWTLGADATAQLVCRLLNDMRKNNNHAIIPRRSEEQKQNMEDEQLMKLNSTYVKKGEAVFPRAGNRKQWEPRSYYWKDLLTAWWGDVRTNMEWA